MPHHLLAMPDTNDLGLSCPQGGSFYVCKGAETQFLGCCTIDPCADGKGHCPQDSLRYSSYSKDSYVSIPPENCASPYNSSFWYTCANAVPPFVGCCASNPCNVGCAQKDLLAAAVDSDPARASVFLTGPATSSSSTTKGASSLSTAAIVGIAIGCSLAALIAVSILYILYRKKQKRTQNELAASGKSNTYGTPGMYMPSPYQDSFGSPGSPPYNTGQQYANKNIFGIMNSPGQTGYDRPLSTAQSWVSGPGTVMSTSVGSDVSQQWAFQPQTHRLVTVSEMGDTGVPRPVPELAGSVLQLPPLQAHKPGYQRVSTDADEN